MSKANSIEASEIFSILSDTINGANFDDLCDATHMIVHIAGYRKQKEGKWIEQVRVSKEGKPLLRHYKCNLCGVYLATQANFCPNCGAKMKGGK